MRRTSRNVNSIFRGGLIRNLINMVRVLFVFCITLVKIAYRLIRIPIVIALWIIGLDYGEIENRIERKMRTYLT